MSEVLAAAIVLGSVYALLGAAVALVSVSTRTLHLAVGEILVAGVLLQLVGSVALVAVVPEAVVVLGAVLAGAALAGVLEPLLLARLEGTVQRLVGLAVAAGVIQAATAATLGSRTYRPDPFLDLPAVGGVPGQAVAAIVVGLPLAGAVAGILRWSRWGRRVRVAGGSPRAVLRMGSSPSRLRASALALSGAVAVVAGLLVAPVTFVGAGQGAAFTVRGVAAALVLGRVGPPVAVVAGLALGAVEAVAASLWPGVGGELAVATTVILVLVARGGDERRAWGRAW